MCQLQTPKIEIVKCQHWQIFPFTSQIYWHKGCLNQFDDNVRQVLFHNKKKIPLSLRLCCISVQLKVKDKSCLIWYSSQIMSIKDSTIYLITSCFHEYNIISLLTKLLRTLPCIQWIHYYIAWINILDWKSTLTVILTNLIARSGLRQSIIY